MKKIIIHFLVKMRIYKIIRGLYSFIKIENLKRIQRSFIFYFYNNILSFFPFHFLRIFYLRNILRIQIGKDCFIHMGARFEGKIKIGNNTVIGRRCVLIGTIIIKNNVSITAETYIFSTSHIVNDPNFNCFYATVEINDYAWLGARSIVQPGIIIGRGSVLGSGSVATKNIPDYEIFAGTPARQIGKRTENLIYNLKYSPYFQ